MNRDDRAIVALEQVERSPEGVQLLVRDLGERRDLMGLAAIAEVSLRELRQLVERPVTCSTLDEILFNLEHLNLDSWETEE
jgi:hypothetical protein